ncbi:MAG: AI-2E family transporter [Acidobacteriota bacterium]|jgi:predicted PurR-regulated permease PerM
MAADGPQPVNVKLDWGGFTLFLITICAVLLCTVIVWPFLPGITGAVVLAVVTRHPYDWLRARLRKPALTAAVAVVLVVLSIVTPAMFVAHGVGHHVLEAVRSLQSGTAEQQFRQFLDEHQRIGEFVRFAAGNVDSGQALQKSAGAVAGKLAGILGRSITALAQIIVMLFVLFFLYRDRGEGLRLIRFLLPLEEEETDYLLNRVQTAVQALVLGRFAVAGIQGVVAGIVFGFLGMGGATVLGMTTTLFALVPAVGAYVVWLPVAIYLALLHHWIRAVVLVAIGSTIISTLDNILYPILVGSRLRLHTVPIFLAMIGGVVFFGVSGLILGPVAFNVSASLVHVWRSRTRGEPLPSDSAAD